MHCTVQGQGGPRQEARVLGLRPLFQTWLKALDLRDDISRPEQGHLLRNLCPTHRTRKGSKSEARRLIDRWIARSEQPLNTGARGERPESPAPFPEVYVNRARK